MLSPESQTEEVTTFAGELAQLAQGVVDEVQTIQEKYDQGQLDPGPLAALRDKANELAEKIKGMIGERQGTPDTGEAAPAQQPAQTPEQSQAAPPQ